MDNSSILWLTSIIVASLVAALAIYTMGLFGGNQFPVEGKVHPGETPPPPVEVTPPTDLLDL